MPEILIESLSREQIWQLSKVLEIFDQPNDTNDTIATLKVLEAARQWYLNRQQEFRMQERRNA